MSHKKDARLIWVKLIIIQNSVGPDLCPYCLQMLSTDDKRTIPVQILIATMSRKKASYYIMEVIYDF